MTVEQPVLELVQAGMGVALQDTGRLGWRRYGLPPGGAMDDHAARWANVLLDNSLHTPVLELLMNGARLKACRRVNLAVTGAALSPRGGQWCTFVLEEDEEWEVTMGPAGVWSYVAVRGGFLGPRWFGSVSVYSRGGLGEPPAPGTVIGRPEIPAGTWPAALGRRWVDPVEQRNYACPPPLRVWPGPQWELFSGELKGAFFGQAWKISARSDRTGYRLEGDKVKGPEATLPSEPVLPGTIQIPPDGGPLVTLRDGPTVGGYPKLGLVDPTHLSWLVQCRPGQSVRFAPVGEAFGTTTT